MNIAIQFMQTVRIPVPDNQRCQVSHRAKGLDEALSINGAIQIKAAEYWLKLGEADQALRELERLPHSTGNHSSAVGVRVAAMLMLNGQTEVAI
jgi:hypothetical protein